MELKNLLNVNNILALGAIILILVFMASFPSIWTPIILTIIGIILIATGIGAIIGIGLIIMSWVIYVFILIMKAIIPVVIVFGVIFGLIYFIMKLNKPETVRMKTPSGAKIMTVEDYCRAEFKTEEDIKRCIG